jgi:Tetratricopeptide repeat
MARALYSGDRVLAVVFACAAALAAGAAPARADEERFLRPEASSGTSAAASVRNTPGTVKDPHFGEVLFYFFQENYFSALSRLMVAQHFGRVPHHDHEAELLRGGMLLSYGMDQEAGRIFQALIDAGAPPSVRDRAWFYLAKIRYQRGRIAEAEYAIARVRGPLPGELEAERTVLHATLLMRRKQYGEAIRMLQKASSRSEWAAYGRYNLGVALIQAGLHDGGVTLLDEIGRSPAKGEELTALRDKANVALAYSFLQSNSPARAEPYLERVRLNGLMSNKALLGMGWAQAGLNQYERALVPWMELADRPTSDTAVQESLLAVPFALGKLGAYRQSLERYERALDAYTSEIARLDEAIASIRRGALVQDVLRDNPGNESGWYWQVRRVPDTPEGRYLLELLASNDFQEGLKNYRDLEFLSRQLDASARNIGTYRDILAVRRQGFAERLPRVTAGARALQLDQLRAAYLGEVERLSRIETEEDAETLAGDKERSLALRLERVRAGLGSVSDPAEREAAQEKYRRLRGLLTWDLSAQYSTHLRNVDKALQETGRLISQAEARREELMQAQEQAPARFVEFEKRIDAMSFRVSQMQAGVRVAAQEQADYLGDVAIAELGQRREQMVAYIAQARFAVAQIYDRAMRVTEKAR